MNYQTYINQRLANPVDFSIGETLSRGFSLFGKAPGPYIGFLIVMIIISATAGAVAGLIPFAGEYVVNIVLTPALTMGFAIYAHKKETGDFAEFSNFFDGFKTNYAQLIVVNLIIQIIVGVVGGLLVLSMIGDITLMIQDVALDPSVAEEVLEDIFARVLENWWKFVIYFLLVFVVQILYMLANYFVIFFDFSFWDALEASRQLMGKVFFKAILYLVVVGFIVTIGTIVTLGFGLLVIIPAITLMQYSIFEQLAGFEEVDPAIEDDLII